MQRRDAPRHLNQIESYCHTLDLSKDFKEIAAQLDKIAGLVGRGKLSQSSKATNDVAPPEAHLKAELSLSSYPVPKNALNATLHYAFDCLTSIDAQNIINNAKCTFRHIGTTFNHRCTRNCVLGLLDEKSRLNHVRESNGRQARVRAHRPHNAPWQVGRVQRHEQEDGTRVDARKGRDLDVVCR